MRLALLSLLSIAGCALGLVLLVLLMAEQFSRLQDHQDEVREMIALEKRIDEFSSASDNLLLFGPGDLMWQAYEAEGDSLVRDLRALAPEHPDAIKAVRHIETITATLERHVVNGPSAGGAANRVGPLGVPLRSRVIMHQVASHGVALDTVLDDLMAERREAVARDVMWLVTSLAAAALFFGALCMFAFGLIHRRVGMPARALTETLERLRAGDAAARAPVTGADELARLSRTLNQALDEREAADRALAERQQQLESALVELERTRDRLLRAQEVARIGSWEVDLGTGRLEWSEQVFEIFGLAPESFGATEEAFFERIHPDDREWMARRRAQWLEQGGSFEAEHRIVRPDGEVRWVREQARILHDEAGRPAFTTGTVQDVTEQRSLSDRLYQFHELIEGTEDLCGIADRDYRYLWVNRAYTERYGLTREEIEGRLLPEIVGAEHFEREIRPRVDRCLAGEPQRFETEREFPGLGVRRLLARYYRLEIPGDTGYRVGAVITDVTEVRAAEAERARQARLIDMAGRAARFGAWSVDLVTGSVEWSDVVADIHAMPPGYAPTLEEGIAFYAPEYRGRITELFTACAERGEAYDEELQIIDAEGRRVWVRAVGEPVRDADGAIVRVQGAFQDVSARKRQEVRLYQYRELIEHSPNPICLVDSDYRYVFVNEVYARRAGTTPAELEGRSVREFLGPDLFDSRIQPSLDRCLAGEPQEYESRFPLADLGERDLLVRYQPVAGARGEANHVAVSIVDVTELKRAERELEGALATRQVLINSLPAQIALLDTEGTIVDVNRQWRYFAQANGYPGGDFGVGRNYVSVCEHARGESAEEAGEVAQALREILDPEGSRDRFVLEYPCHAPDEQRWFRLMVNRLLPSESQQAGAVVMHVDITERKLAEIELNRIAYEDRLTGLASRNGFAHRLGRHLAAGGWDAAGLVVVLDVVNLHDINQAQGYEQGDELLAQIGARLHDRAAAPGLAGRTGGDQFVLYLHGGEERGIPERLDTFADEVMHGYVLRGGIRLDIGIRIGFTRLGEDERTAEELLHEAELALFQNRADPAPGRRWLGFTREMEQASRERIRLTDELRSALDGGQFELHFQPKVDLRDGRVIAAEGLLRWQHPERGLQSPGVFIPVAEQSQLIGPIGDWALRDACRQLRAWHDAGLQVVRVAVNVSLVQFMFGDFPARVRAALDEHGIDPSELTLEITESVFERHSEQLLTSMRELHELGVRLSLDDFGTGYSSLLYLQRYPFDEIKIDQGFVRRMIDDRYSEQIVRTVMSLATALEAETVGEGVESAAERDALLEMGCRVGQGYYYSVPLAPDDFRWLLEQHTALPLYGSSAGS